MDILALKTLVREVGSAIGQSDDLGEKAASMMHLAVVFEVEGLVALRDWEPLLAAIEVRPCLQPLHTDLMNCTNSDCPGSPSLPMRLQSTSSLPSSDRLRTYDAIADILVGEQWSSCSSRIRGEEC